MHVLCVVNEHYRCLMSAQGRISCSIEKKNRETDLAGCLICSYLSREDLFFRMDLFVFRRVHIYMTTNITYSLVGSGLSGTPNIVDRPAKVVDAQLNDKSLDLQLFEHAFIPSSASGTLWLTNIARLEKLSEVAQSSDRVVCARLSEMFVGGKQAINASLMSLIFSHVLASLDEAADVLGHLEFDNGVVRELEFVAVADGERQVKTRVLVLYDLVEGLELLCQHLLVDFHG